MTKKLKPIDVDALQDYIDLFIQVSKDSREDEKAQAEEDGHVYIEPERQKELLEYFLDQVTNLQESGNVYSDL